MKVIMPAGEIPRSAVVSKIGGKVRFTLSDSIKIYYPDKSDPMIVECDKECLFFIPVDGKPSVSAIPLTKEVLWEVSEEELFDYLSTKIEGDSQ